MKKYILTSIVIFSLVISLFVNTVNVYAIGTINSPVAVINGFKESIDSAVEKVQNDTFSFSDFTNVLKRGSDIVGIMYDTSTMSTSDIAGWLRGYSSGGHSFSIPENATDDEVIEEAVNYLNNNITFDTTNNTITFNDNSKNMYNYIYNSYKDDVEAYCYTFGMQTNADMFSSVEQYNKAKEKINDANTLLGGLWFVVSNTIYSFDTTGVRDIYFKEVNSSSVTSNGNSNVKVYNADTNEQIPASAQYNWSSSEHDFVAQTNVGNINNYTKYVGLEPDPKRWSDGKYLIMTSKSKTYRYFKWNHTVTTNDILYSQYYINQPVYNDFSNSQGDYTFNPQNINTVSYGDVTSYVDSYNTENGNPPPVYDINNYITQQNEQNVDNGSGGSGGSGDNGGGSGGDNGGGSSDSNIFDFLSDIGAVLGNLIKNLGNVLTELISGIAEIITGLFEAIPTIFGDFLGALLGWLPDEIRALIILGITAMIIVGIIKVIRG